MATHSAVIDGLRPGLSHLTPCKRALASVLAPMLPGFLRQHVACITERSMLLALITFQEVCLCGLRCRAESPNEKACAVHAWEVAGFNCSGLMSCAHN